MTFNWFDRAAQAEEPAILSPEEKTISAATPAPEEALTFAKAAYERLKQKQQAAAAAKLALESVAEEAVSDAGDVKPVELESPIAAIESASESINESVSDPEIITETEAPEIRPLWMQTQAETEARL